MFSCLCFRFVCEVHGVPAVRRRCSHGVHKDRRFYVCGLERRERCSYFKWSDEVPDKTEKFQDQNLDRDGAHDLFLPVLVELQKVFREDELQKGLISLIGNRFEKKQADSIVSEAAVVNEGSSVNFPSLTTESEKMQDVEDGVYRTLEKFGKSKPMSMRLEEDDSLSASMDSDGTDEAFLYSSLDLFSLLAPKMKSTKEVSSKAWSSEWFSVLCEIISTGTSSVLRHLAKAMLLRLCGGCQGTYHRVRDHYVYGFQVGWHFFASRVVHSIRLILFCLRVD